MQTTTRTRTDLDPPPVLTARQQRELLRLPDCRRRKGRRDAALISILVGGGLRVGEAVRLRVQDIERGPNGSIALVFKTLKRKDHRRRVYLFPPFVTPVQRYIAASAPRYWLFDGHQGEHLSVRAAQHRVSAYLRQVRPDMRLHDLRHTCATDVLRHSGGDVWLTANMLGHADTRQVMTRYGHYLVKDALRAGEHRASALSRKGAAA